MSGIIDDKGVQWEHCTSCNKFVRIDDLGFEPPLKATPCGRDLCISCVNKLPQWRLRRIRPAAGWLPQYEKKGTDSAPTTAPEPKQIREMTLRLAECALGYSLFPGAFHAGSHNRGYEIRATLYFRSDMPIEKVRIGWQVYKPTTGFYVDGTGDPGQGLDAFIHHFRGEPAVMLALWHSMPQRYHERILACFDNSMEEL